MDKGSGHSSEWQARPYSREKEGQQTQVSSMLPASTTPQPPTTAQSWQQPRVLQSTATLPGLVSRATWICCVISCEKVKVLVAQLCPTLCDPMNCSLPGSSVHGILQARILEWNAISFSKGSSQCRDRVTAGSQGQPV